MIVAQLPFPSEYLQTQMDDGYWRQRRMREEAQKRLETEMSNFADDETLALIVNLQQQLAAEQAYGARLRVDLKQVIATCDHTDNFGFIAQEHARKTLALPHDDSALREWGARLLETLANESVEYTDHNLRAVARDLRSGDWKP